MAKAILHGMLHVTIHEVDVHPHKRGLWDAVKKAWSKIKEEFYEWWNKNTEYATISIEDTTVGATRITKHESNPKWHETFHIYCAYMTSDIIFAVKDDEILIKDSTVGRAYFPVDEELLDGNEIDTWLVLLDDNGKPIQHEKHGLLQIHVKVQFVDVTKDLNWGKGIQTPDFPGVPFTFFPQREGCKVTLYQDAHVAQSFAPRIPLSEGKYYEPHRCWEDVFDAIDSARHLIYITGWSVYTEITLVRDPERPRPGGDMTLGELLKKKAQEGVRVLMLVWENKLENFQKTHDKETLSYFHGSEVHCVLCPRELGKGRGMSINIATPYIFTHHQKSLVVDSPIVDDDQGSNKRTIVSFVGGIDLCDGRYDTQSHSLFRTLDTIHGHDFYQSSIEGASLDKGGPREPWHDVHSRLEGPIAWDVLCNFEQRWRKQARSHDPLLLNISQMSDIFVTPSPVTSLELEDHETWNVQLFRSIDAGAVVGFPDSPKELAKLGLTDAEGNTVERSIQDAYINAIRRAKRFIYIENQYFLGSSFGWKQNTDSGAIHLIPKELSLKIVSKIEKGERFSVYIVVPMWPEGVPENPLSVQPILYWQRRTTEMMYADVSKAISDKGIEANPKDYLSFFCLGNREVKKSGEYEPPRKPELGTDYSEAQQHRRFMIYVHAKTMIVDDEYIIVGSANLNQRSMDGSRDSEIAMGAYQPHNLNSENQHARGQVHGFRMSLWYEHLGLLDDVFLHPESLGCVRKVNQVAEKYWELYTCDNLGHDLPGHLLSYPIEVTQDGEVKDLAGFEHFPDTNGQISGTEMSGAIPPILTTY